MIGQLSRPLGKQLVGSDGDILVDVMSIPIKENATFRAWLTEFGELARKCAYNLRRLLVDPLPSRFVALGVSGLPNDRHDHFALPNPGEAGRRRHGSGVQSRGHRPAPICGAEVLAERGIGFRNNFEIPEGGAGGVCAEPSEHLHDL